MPRMHLVRSVNLCQVVPYVSYPPRMGGDHRSHGLVKEFPEAGDTVARYCQGGSPAMYRSLDLRRCVRINEGYVERRHLNPIHELAKAPMLIGYPNLFASRTLKFASDGLGRMFADADVILAREPWQMPYVLDHAPDDTPVVFSSHNVESERFGSIDQPLFERRTERWVRELERRSVEETDAIVCTSERDRRRYEEMYDLDGPTVVAPNGTYEDDLREHRPDSDRAHEVRRQYGIPEDRTVCLFMGSNYRPNVDAAEAAVEATRRANDEGIPMHLLVMGSVGKALSDADLPEAVTTTGYVEDGFEAHFDTADVALNPMRIGGGTNIKLIDYMARSLPIVSTPFGVRGLDATPGEHLVVAELSEFPEAVAELGADAARRRELGTAARELAAEKYTWESASRTLRTRLQDLFGPF